MKQQFVCSPSLPLSLSSSRPLSLSLSRSLARSLARSPPLTSLHIPPPLLLLSQHKKGFPGSHLPSALSHSLPCFVYQRQELHWHDPSDSIFHLQPPRTSSASRPVCHQPSFRVIFSICFHRLRVSSMSPSDRRRRFRLQALPGSSASKTPLLVFNTPALA